MLLLSACVMAGSDAQVPCPPIVDYSGTDQAMAADEVEALPEGAVIIRMLRAPNKTGFHALRGHEQAPCIR